MKILNTDTNSPTKNICIYLTSAEALQMLGYLEQLVAEPDEHYHLNDEDFEREISLVIYNPNDLSGFDARSKRLIENDE